MNRLRQSGITAVFSAALIFITLTFTAQAGQVTVVWTQPDQFTDIRVGDQPRQPYRQQLFRAFEKHFAKLAQQLPAGYHWHVNITDMDLAGDVNGAYNHKLNLNHGLRRVRVLSGWFKTAVEFSYRLLDPAGKLLAADDIVLKETRIERFPRHLTSRRSFAYEQYLIKQWFRQTLMAQLKTGSDKKAA